MRSVSVFLCSVASDLLGHVSGVDVRTHRLTFGSSFWDGTRCFSASCLKNTTRSLLSARVVLEGYVNGFVSRNELGKRR